MLVVAAEGADLTAQSRLVPLLQGEVTRNGQATAYVCERRVCKLPTADPQVFARQIQKVEPLRADGPGPARRRVRGVQRRFYPYKARGVPYDPDDGTLAPWAVAASLPFAPEIVLPTLRH